MAEIKKAIDFVSILRFKKDDNEIKVEGHLSNEEKMKLVKSMIEDGWKPAEDII